MTKSRSKNKKKVFPKTRKEVRKEKRQQKKLNKKQFFEKKKNTNNDEKLEKNQKTKKEISKISDDEIESDFELSDEEINTKLNKVEKKKPKEIPKPDRFLETQQKEKKQQRELERKMRKRRMGQLKAANEEEDKIIRRLGKKLKIDKSKSVKSVHKMFNDGLDYALELCLPENIEKMYSAAKEAANLENSDDDFQEDFEIALGKSEKAVPTKAKKNLKSKQKLESKQESEKKQSKLKEIEKKYFKDDFDSDLSGDDSEFENTGSDSDSDNDDDDDDDEESLVGKKTTIEDSEDSDFDIVQSDEEDNEDGGKEMKEESDDEGEQDEKDGLDTIFESLDSEEENNDDESASKSDKNEGDGENSKPGIWEDIYGRQRDNKGNVVDEKPNKYVPPHIRARLEAESGDDMKRKEKLQNLRRHCKGFLNRLSETNMHKIASDLENLYMKNSRFDMNNTLCSLILEALVSNILSKERMVLEYAMLVAVLHANVGNEIGAHFLQTLVTKFDHLNKNIQNLNVENKELDNIIFLLSHFYTFKIFQHSLIYELINKLCENLCEKSVECLLLILKSIGFQLRKDDPIALKNLILSIQEKATKVPANIKENTRLNFMLDILQAIKNNNMNKIPQYDPTLAEHLKKILKSMLVNGKYVSTLNITMEDLLKADEKGKWWVIGSAWTGNIQDMNTGNLSSKQNTNDEKFSEHLLILAKQQRMNTEDRRNVFCIIMSAEDYIDAFERLLHLSIKDQRIIVSIIIHCCISEKAFNPYYAVLGQKFCEYERKYQLATQFALWDRIKDVHSLTNLQIKNLAQFLIHLITNGALPVSVLKIVEFAELDKTTLRLVRQIILGILFGKEENCRQVFERIAPSTKLNGFKDSIRLFMHHFLLKGGTKNDLPLEQMNLLKARIGIVDKALETCDSKVKF